MHIPAVYETRKVIHGRRETSVCAKCGLNINRNFAGGAGWSPWFAFTTGIDCAMNSKPKPATHTTIQLPKLT